MKIGFTGTRQGMSNAQADRLQYVLAVLRHSDRFVSRETEFHHGGAQGADRQAADLARALGYGVHWHPTFGVTADESNQWDIWHEVFPPLRRNMNIATECSLLIAAPEFDKEQLRSGTWATVRYARKAHKPVVMLAR